MELTKAPEPISERRLRVRFQGREPPLGRVQGFCDSFPAGGGVAEVVTSGPESKQSAD